MQGKGCQVIWSVLESNHLGKPTSFVEFIIICFFNTYIHIPNPNYTASFDHKESDFMGKIRKQGGITSKDNNQPRQLSLSLHTKQSTTDLISCLKSQVFERFVYTTNLK